MPSNELTEDEKARVIAVAQQFVIPIAQEYEMDSEQHVAALMKAFQAGVKFAVKEMEENGYGGSQSTDDQSRPS
jgi:hypothetical protein